MVNFLETIKREVALKAEEVGEKYLTCEEYFTYAYHIFADEGHSGFSAGYAIRFINTFFTNYDNTKSVDEQLNALLPEAVDDEEDIGSPFEGMQLRMNTNITNVIKQLMEMHKDETDVEYIKTTGLDFGRLLNGKPLTAITEEDGFYDNGFHKRCLDITKDADGVIRNTKGKIFSDDGGSSWYSCADGRIEITLPYYVPSYSEKVILEEEVDEEISNDVTVDNLNASDEVIEETEFPPQE